jgi:outer membrane protein TolC
LYYNNRIKKELSVAEEITLGQYRRELIAEIRKAYYTVGMSQSLMNMYHQTRMLLVENIRVNTRLVENNKVTRDILLRSQTELSKFDQSLQDAEKNRKVSVAYFNFLLNRPLGDSVIIESPSELLPISGQTESFISSAVDNREEIKKLEQYNRINQLTTRMNQSGKLPNLMVVADYGFQGEKYAFNKDQDYLQASAILSWDLFNGFQNRVKIKQSEMNQERIVQQIEEAKQGIALQVISALESVKTAEAGLVAAKAQVSTAREAFRLVMRKYEEGQASLIEFMDARNSMTQAEENLIISVYTCLSFKAEFEKVIAAKTE